MSVEFRLYHYKVPFLKNGKLNWIIDTIYIECLYLLSDIRFCISMVFAKIDFCRICYRETDLKTMKSRVKYNFLKIQIFKIFDTVDRTQFLTTTRDRKEEYEKLSLFQLKWPILRPSASSLFFTCFSRSTRSSHQLCSVEKGVLRYFAKFTRKHLCQSLFFNNVAGRRSTIVFKKSSLT